MDAGRLHATTSGTTRGVTFGQLVVGNSLKQRTAEHRGGCLCQHDGVQPQLDIWERQTTICPDCRGKRVVYTGEAVADDATVAVFWAFLYDHPGNPEVFIDATFGTWGVDG